MERNIRRLLLILLVFFVLSAPPPGAAKNYIKRVHTDIYVARWGAAASFCRHDHDGFLTIDNQREAEEIFYERGWIGLFLDANKWKWSAGGEEAKFLLWDDGEPVEGQDCAWKDWEHLGWKTANCSEFGRYLCMAYDGILVQEKKTWEEALVHCRELHSDLASLPETKRNKLLNRVILLDREALRRDANTAEVWVGLRFLAGEWLWMSGEAASSPSLPQCPAHQLHCGAVGHNDTNWKIMDCSEKRNFLCTKKKKT